MTVVVSLIVIPVGIWAASQWWERALATKLGADISPNGCYRFEDFKPFWVLPNIFHPMAHPDDVFEPDTVKPKWFPWWESPGFLRLYDNRTNALIAESNIYDFASAGGQLDWVGRYVSAGMMFIGPIDPDCVADQPADSPASSAGE
jgi:hypothetical protein